MITGIVLAGGESRRMGCRKALLELDGETFLERVVRTLREGGCDDVVVVLNGDVETDRLTEGAGGRSTPGGGAGSEQIDSLRAGIRALPADAEAAVVLPVDHPMVQPSTVATLIAAYRRGQRAIIRVRHAGKTGHPVLFAATVFKELLEGHLAEGARSVIRAHEEDQQVIEVDDPGVLVDVDTPAEYDHHIGRRRDR